MSPNKVSSSTDRRGARAHEDNDGTGGDKDEDGKGTRPEGDADDDEDEEDEGEDDGGDGTDADAAAGAGADANASPAPDDEDDSEDDNDDGSGARSVDEDKSDDSRDALLMAAAAAAAAAAATVGVATTASVTPLPPLIDAAPAPVLTPPSSTSAPLLSGCCFSSGASPHGLHKRHRTHDLGADALPPCPVPASGMAYRAVSTDPPQGCATAAPCIQLFFFSLNREIRSERSSFV
jgi:hypothetical protein